MGSIAAALRAVEQFPQEGLAAGHDPVRAPAFGLAQRFVCALQDGVGAVAVGVLGHPAAICEAHLHGLALDLVPVGRRQALTHLGELLRPSPALQAGVLSDFVDLYLIAPEPQRLLRLATEINPEQNGWSIDEE